MLVHYLQISWFYVQNWALLFLDANFIIKHGTCMPSICNWFHIDPGIFFIDKQLYMVALSDDSKMFRVGH